MSAAKLPLLADRRAELETCGYCPKLCRAACPVSEVEGSETLTPWGKMSLAWFSSRGDVRLDAAHARTAWACAGCHACRERCEHSNPVADTLFDARAEYFGMGVAPRRVKTVAERHRERRRGLADGIAALRREPGVQPTSSFALLIGCAYVRRAPDVALDAFTAALSLLGPCRLVDVCCGAPLWHAGDRRGYESTCRELEASIGSADLVIVDPGCATTPYLRSRKPRLLVDVAAESLGRLHAVRGLGADASPLRWHDPCHLGRGLGRFDEPRAILSRALGRPPEEFPRAGARAECSGGGGLLPAVMPAVSERIARRRVLEHDRAGGGVIVTACAASRRRLQSVGERVVDLNTVIRRALGGE